MLKRITYIAALGFFLTLLLPAAAQAALNSTMTIVKATVEPGSPGRVDITDVSDVHPDAVIELDCIEVGSSFTPEFTFEPHGSTRSCYYSEPGKYRYVMRASYAGDEAFRLSREFTITPGDELPEGISVVGSDQLSLPGALVLASPKPNLDFACREAGCGDPTIKRSGPVNGLYQYAVHLDVASLGPHTAMATAWRNDSRFAEAQSLAFTVVSNKIDPFRLLDRQWFLTRKGQKCLVEDSLTYLQTDEYTVTQTWTARLSNGHTKTKRETDQFFGAYSPQGTQFGLAVSPKSLPARVTSKSVITSGGRTVYKKTNTLKMTPKVFKKRCGR